MKKYVAAAGLLLGCMGNAAAQPIFGGPPLLSDPELQQCLEETALSESWTQTEQVTHLACADRNIESASGLDNFPDLTSLDLSGNALMSAAGMHSLTGLVQLLLSDNAGMDINDIAPILANNTGLTHLGLAGITIEYLSQLPLYNSQTSNHYDLIELDISRTGITDLGYLMNFPSLQRLDVSGNAIGEIFPWYLESLTQLTAIDLSDNALSSVQGLDFHTGLIELNLSNNADLEIYDVIPILANNVGLAQIGLGGIDIADFYQLPLNNPQTSSTYQLVELDLSRTGITDVNRLYEFPNLRRLNLSGNGISNINPWLLEQLTQLTAIDLSDNALNSVQGLDFHTSLTELNLSNNAGLELYAILPILAYNTGLTHIGLGGIAITDLNQLPLYNAQTNSTYRLFELDVSHTGISNTARLYEFPNLRRLDLSGNQLTDISSGIDQMPGLTALDLSDNRLTYLPWLNGLRQLTELNLSNNTGIEFNQVVPVIASNTRLTHLGLGGIALTDLYQIPLNDPYKLLELDVSHTGINNTARLYEFRNLERLDLSGNQLTDIGSGIDQMPGLTALDLSDNRLTYLPGLNGLQRLTELNLSNNAGIEFNQVAPVIASNTRLTHLGLGGIALTDLYQIPLNDPYKLLELDVSHTGINNTARLYEFRNLERLDLSGNQLTDIGSGIDQMPGLTALDLSDNRLTYLPGLNGLQRLTELNLSNNAGIEFNQVAPVIASNTRLTHLGLGGIALTDLYQIPLNDPYKLLELDVSHTGINNTARLYEFPNLRRLDLSGNQLTDIGSGIDQMPGLTALDLSDNRLTYLPWLNGLQRLTELNLSNNAGIEFNQVAPVIASNTRLTHLGLGGIALTDLYQIPLNDPYKLLELDVSHTGINNTARLYEFPQLCRLNLSNNQLTSIDGLDPLRYLTELNLSNNAGIDVNAVLPILANNVRLTHLGLGGIAIADLNQLPLHNPQTGRDYALVELDISRTGITDLNRLNSFPGLRRLNLSGNQLTTLGSPPVILAMPGLIALDLSDNHLINTDGLEQLRYLTELNLSNNNGIDINAVLPILSNNTGLTHIGLGGIAIADLYQLPLHNQMTNRDYDLIELDISNTGITDLTRLAAFPHLRNLNLSGNQLTTLGNPSIFDQLLWLNTLDLSDNNLTDINGLGAFDYLAELNLSGNTQLQCDDLDYLGSLYGSSSVLRPAGCLYFNPPSVQILTPEPNTEITANRLFTLSGMATDIEDGSLNSVIQWQSSLAGVLGSGADIQIRLNAGTHTITASVTDSHTNSSSVTVSVQVVDGPDGDLNGDGSVNAADVLLGTQALTSNTPLTAYQMLHGDVAPLVNGIPAPDGQFNAGDLLVIQRKAIGAIDF